MITRTDPVYSFNKIITTELEATVITSNGMELSNGGTFDLPSGGEYEFKIDGTDIVNIKETELKTDTVNELTIDAGVTIDEVLIKDNEVVADNLFSLNNPTLDTHVANKTYVDSISAGIIYKDPVLVVSESNIVLSVEQTIDGVLTSTSRVLLVGQTDLTENGVYDSAAGAWIRTTDMDLDAEFPQSAFYVDDGDVGAGKQYICTNSTAPTLGVDDITFVQFAGQSSSTIILADTINEKTAATGVTIDGMLIKDSEPTCAVINSTGSGIDVDGLHIEGGQIDIDVINEESLDAGVTVDGVLCKDGNLSANIINELTPDNGVSIDGVICKDSVLSADIISEKTGDAGVTIDGVLIKDAYVSTDTILEKTTDNGIDIDGIHIENETINVDIITEKTVDEGVTIETMLLKDAVLSTDNITELSVDAGTEINGVLLKSNEVTCDQINEKVVGTGVTIDGLIIKDNGILGATGIYGNGLSGALRPVYVDSLGNVGYDTSVRKNKMNINYLDYEDSVKWLYKLAPVKYNYKMRNERGINTGHAVNSQEYGLIAEEVLKVNPNLCIYTDEKNKRGLEGVLYNKLISPIISALKFHKITIDIVVERNKQLENTVKLMNREINNLKKRRGM